MYLNTTKSILKNHVNKHLKNNWSFDKMVEKINQFMPKTEVAPQIQTLNLPKLKKTTKTELPKLKLPKLKKIEA